MADVESKAGSSGYLGFVKHQVESKPLIAFGIIILLIILLIATYVYYHGLFIFGPFAGKQGAKPREKSKGKSKDDDEEKGDDETEKLIDSINSAAKKQPVKGESK
jgi:hypothetical protein